MRSYVVLTAQVLADITLIDDYDLRRINVAALLRRLHAHSKA